jgi:hypothetical protein
MRGFDRDLIRGGHYGQRSCEPHQQAEHMAAPTKPANVKKALANSEPSTHGTFETLYDVQVQSAIAPDSDISPTFPYVADVPEGDICGAAKQRLIP